MNGQQWGNRVIKLNLDTRDLDQKKVFVGDEAGVQGRFQEAIGQTLGKVFEAQGLDIQFADFKCLPNLGNKVPDCIMKTSTNELKLVGELKVPWVSHRQARTSCGAASVTFDDHLMIVSLFTSLISLLFFLCSLKPLFPFYLRNLRSLQHD